MVKLGALILVILLLASCMPTDVYSLEGLTAGMRQATAEALRAKTESALNTQSASNSQAALLEAQSQATKSALSVKQTETADLATQQALAFRATESAKQTATAQPFAATKAFATQQAFSNQIKRDEDHAARQRLLDWVLAVFPLAMLIFVLVFLLIASVIVFKESYRPAIIKATTISRGENTVPLVQLGSGGKHHVVDMSRSFTPVITVDKKGAMPSGGASETVQLKVTSQAQFTEVIRALPAQSPTPVRDELNKAVAQLLSGQQTVAEHPQIEIIDSSATAWRPILADVESKMEEVDE